MINVNDYRSDKSISHTIDQSVIIMELDVRWWRHSFGNFILIVVKEAGPDSIPHVHHQQQQRLRFDKDEIC